MLSTNVKAVPDPYELEFENELELRLRLDIWNTQKYLQYGNMYKDWKLTAYWALDMISKVIPSPNSEYIKKKTGWVRNLISTREKVKKTTKSIYQKLREEEERLKEQEKRAKRIKWNIETQGMTLNEKAAYWWWKQLSPSGEYNNGEGNIANIIQISRSTVTQEEIKRFIEVLTEELNKAEPDYRGIIILYNEYWPDKYLTEACKSINIEKLMILPSKTIMEINPSQWKIKLFRRYWENEEL
jgi:predicted transcriptional regulator